MTRPARCLTAFLLFLLIAAVGFAQETTGAIEGVVKDSMGAVLPGVTMEATKPGGGTVSTTTDSTGTYRFPRLPSGRYSIKASLMGYNTNTTKNIDLTLGKTATVNMTLAVAAVSESLTVTAEAPIVDVTQSAISTSIAREQLELLPKARDFSSVVTFAPGASNESFLAGISVDGASGLENRYVIDGVDTTHPYDGKQGQKMVTDFIEEVQVKSAGYTAEYGGSLGGVINVVTKSGTNDFQGFVTGMYSNLASGAQRPSPYESAPSNYFTFKKDADKQLDPSAGLGGPLFRDHMWFYFGYNPAEEKITRHPMSIDGVDGPSRDQTVKSRFYLGNINGNVGSKFLYKFAANFSPQKTEGVLPARDNSTPANMNLDIIDKKPTKSYSAYADFLPASSFYLSGRAGKYTTDINQSGFTATSRVLFYSGTVPDPASPLYRPKGFSSVPAAAFSGTNYDFWDRKTGSLEGNYFFSGLGQHSVKAGFQYQKISNRVSLGEVGNLFRIRWGAAYIGVKGTYGSVEVRRFRTEGGADSFNTGIYLQDAWSIRPNLTLNIGVRSENEKVPNYGYAVDPTLPKYAMQWNYGDKIAPRLGFAWDVLSNQKLKVYGDYGLYYDIMKIDMSRQSFGAAKWISYVYPLNTMDWTTLANGCKTSQNIKTDNVCPALGNAVTRDFRKPTDPRTAIDPNLKPMENREYEIGTDYQINKNSVFGIRYVNKKLLNTIEDIGYLDFATGDEIYTTGNPGKGIVAGDPPGPVPPQPTAVRDYQAAELSYNKRFGDNWSLRAIYTWSQLKGNYSGLASSDEFGRADPNIERFFDAITNAFDQNGQEVLGALNTDRPHSIKIEGLYRTKWETAVGLNQLWASGTPVSEEVYYNLVPFFPHGRGNLGRTPNLSQTDVMLVHPIHFGSYRLEASINVLNVFDQKAVTRIWNQHYKTDLADIDPKISGLDGSYEAFFSKPFDTDKIMKEGGAEVDPFYNRPYAWQTGRTFRLGLKFVF